MLLMPVVSTNIRPKNNHPSFGGIDYTISCRAGKVVRALAEKPNIKTRGLLEALYAFLEGADFQARMGGAKACYIDSIEVSDFQMPHFIRRARAFMYINDILLVHCKVKRLGRTSSFSVQKDSDAIYRAHADEYVQKDKQAAERLLKHLHVPWWKGIFL